MKKKKTEEQQGRCAICKTEPKPKQPQGGSGGLVPDHKHSNPPVPRGMLCHNCNSGLGLFKDCPEILEQAAAYLRKFEVIPL